MGELREAVSVVCGRCGVGPVYFETCDVPAHTWALASECQRCGARHVIKPDGCPDCADPTPEPETP